MVSRFRCPYGGSRPHGGILSDNLSNKLPACVNASRGTLLYPKLGISILNPADTRLVCSPHPGPRGGAVCVQPSVRVFTLSISGTISLAMATREHSHETHTHMQFLCCQDFRLLSGNHADSELLTSLRGWCSKFSSGLGIAC